MTLMKGLKYNQTAQLQQQTLVMNADIVYAAGSSPDYVSKVELDTLILTTATAQLRVSVLSKDPENNEAGSANRNLLL